MENHLLRSVIFLFLALASNNAAALATAPPLGAAASFAVLAATTVGNTGNTTINGDLGNSPGATFTGSATVTLNGTLHLADVTAANAQTDTTTAYNNAAAQACDVGPTGATDLAAATLTPGVYCYSSTLANSGILTLDAQGNNNAVWVFKIGSTLTTTAGATMVFINGGQSSNVFWQVTSSATLGANTSLVGNILALTSITLTTGATVSGRILARTGAVTLDTNSILLPPIIGIVKSVVTATDPVNGTTFPKAIPGAEMQYTITATNSGYGIADNNSTVVTDAIPVGMKLCVSTLCSNPPVTFTCSATPACGLSYTYASNVSYSNQPGGGAPYNYTAIPDAAGYDASVTGVRINPSGVFSAASGGNNASFTLVAKMKVQ